MNFSSVPRTSSMVEDDGTFAEYRMSRNCAREPDAKRSYIKANAGTALPNFNNEKFASLERVNAAHVNYKVGVPVYILILAIYLKPQRVSWSMRKDWKEQTG
jgi:hypothetical protein